MSPAYVADPFDSNVVSKDKLCQYPAEADRQEKNRPDLPS
jgi:hypothetical protein